MDVAFGRLNFRRVRNDSRHGGRHTEHRERREKGSLRRIVASLTKAHSILLAKTTSKKEYHVLVATEWHEEPRHILLENTVAPCRWRKISLILVVGQRRLLF